MHRAQGSLEYLVIIGAVLAISATIIMLATSAFVGQQSSVNINACREAAAQCKAVHYSIPKDPCSQCNTACNASGKEVFTGAVTCCKTGQSENIFIDSTGCQAYAPPNYCSDSITQYGECRSQQPPYCNYLGQFVNNCTYCQCSQGSQCNPITESCNLVNLVCADGTYINSCSSTLPKYCNANQQLVDYCSTCYCPSGQICVVATQGCIVSPGQEIFYEEFANLNGWTMGKGANPMWHTNTTFSYNNSNSAYSVAIGGLGYYILRAQSTVGYTNIHMSFWAHPQLQNGNLEVLWSPDGGTNWYSEYIGSNTNSWTYHFYTLSQLADNNANFKLKLLCSSGANAIGGSCAIDTLRITGDILG